VRIAEIYKSLQGEGLLTGTEAVFVRTSGCNLRCRWCDTPHASFKPEGEDLSVEEVLGRTRLLGCSHVVLTGGEPMLLAELIPLCRGLRERRLHVTIETAGTLYLPVVCELMSISPKLSNSTPEERDAPRWPRRHERTRHAPEVIRRLIAEHDYQFKFVIDTPEDCDEVERYLRDMPEIDRRRVMMMPQGRDVGELAERAEWMTPYCQRQGLQFCPRRQIEWFGPVRRT